MSTSTFLSHLRGLPAYRDQAVHVEHIPTSEADYGELKGDQKLLGEIGKQASRDVMARVAVLPILMALCYLGLIFYFRSKGGYKQVELAEGEGAPAQATADAQA